MPRTARDYQYSRNYGYPQTYQQSVLPLRPQAAPIRRKKIQHKRIKRVNPLKRLISLMLMFLIGYYVLPFAYQRVSMPLFFGSYEEVRVDAHDLLFPTSNYLSNDLFLNVRSLNAAETKKPEMTPLYATSNMPVLETNLRKLMAQYKTIDPSIYVWEYDSGKYVDINGDEIYSAASIIKIPVLIQAFKSMEANQFTVYDEMSMTSYFRAEGSGSLQHKPDGTVFTIDELARYMITESDNSSTNMLMAKMGSMTDVNAALRNWGIKHTQVKAWLPDMDGTNYTTARDLATMLYNLDNPGFLNINSREYIIDYMSHVKNNRLIQAGLGEGALFVHKTGDIGKMLGDAGIVFTPQGKKYICVILANRPYNSPLGKDFIQKASSIIYKGIAANQY